MCLVEFAFEVVVPSHAPNGHTCSSLLSCLFSNLCLAPRHQDPASNNCVRISKDHRQAHQCMHRYYTQLQYKSNTASGHMNQLQFWS